MDDYRNSPTIKFCADLFPAHRCPSAIKFKIRLECASVNWSNVLLISKASFLAIKWTECREWKRNSEKFNFSLNLFLWVRINYSRNWECFDQSCANRTETVHGTLRCLYVSHLLYGICVNIFLMNRYVFQRATQRARILLTDNIQSGGSGSVNYY